MDTRVELLARELEQRCSGTKFSVDDGDIVFTEYGRRFRVEKEWLAENDLTIEEWGGQKLWIITEADRSVTTFLFPNEY